MANGADDEPAGLTRTLACQQFSETLSAESTSNDEHWTSGAYAGVCRTMTSNLCHGPVCCLFAGEAKAKACCTSPEASAESCFSTTSTGLSFGDGAEKHALRAKHRTSSRKRMHAGLLLFTSVSAPVERGLKGLWVSRVLGTLPGPPPDRNAPRTRTAKL
jgi:hypothetical protein